MPYDDPDLEDPSELVGMPIFVDGPESVREMVACFAEELAGLGYAPVEVLRIFADPFYASAHGAWQTLGELETRRILEEILGPIEDVELSPSAPVRVRCGNDGDAGITASETQGFEV
ncbi:MAG TPA: hypothetical protein PKA37_08770 [Planctomycetota bacterium]|jgi:hypothetical protein|nr:hypothetical protein [Planctomycetota bacterium]